MDIEQRIADFVEQSIDNEELFLVEVALKGNIGNQKIQVYIDGDSLVDIGECSRISRKLSDLLEEEDIFGGKYTIEVSSPGVSNPLKFIRQYPKHIGRDLQIETKEKKKINGELTEVLDDEICISVSSKKNTEVVKLSFSEIEKAKVQVKF